MFMARLDAQRREVSAMSGVARLEIHGKLDEFKCLATKCAELVRTEDTGTLQYESYFQGDRDATPRTAHGADLSVDTDLAAYLGERAQSQQARMDEVAEKARRGALSDVSIEDGNLRITALKKTTPAAAIEFAEQAYRLMPHVKITESLAEVDGTSHGCVGRRHQSWPHPHGRGLPFNLRSCLKIA